MCCTHDVLSPVGTTEVAERQHGVPSDMSRIHPGRPDSAAPVLLVAANVLLMRQEPDEEEDEEEDEGDGKKNDDDDDEDDDGYSE
jgi:hypothetical protein